MRHGCPPLSVEGPGPLEEGALAPANADTVARQHRHLTGFPLRFGDQSIPVPKRSSVVSTEPSIQRVECGTGRSGRQLNQRAGNKSVANSCGCNHVRANFLPDDSILQTSTRQDAQNQVST